MVSVSCGNCLQTDCLSLLLRCGLVFITLYSNCFCSCLETLNLFLLVVLKNETAVADHLYVPTPFCHSRNPLNFCSLYLYWNSDNKWKRCTLHCVSKKNLYHFLGRLRRVYLIIWVRCPSVRPSTKSFSESDEIWYVGRGRWVMHDGMPYDPIQGQGQGHETFKFRNSSIFKIYLLRHF